MTYSRYLFILSLIFISSCSNLLTWHLDKGIHKEINHESSEPVLEKVQENNVAKKNNIDIVVENNIWVIK